MEQVNAALNKFTMKDRYNFDKLLGGDERALEDFRNGFNEMKPEDVIYLLRLMYNELRKGMFSVFLVDVSCS
jgi:hypothetical protein